MENQICFYQTAFRPGSKKSQLILEPAPLYEATNFGLAKSWLFSQVPGSLRVWLSLAELFGKSKLFLNFQLAPIWIVKKRTKNSCIDRERKPRLADGGIVERRVSRSRGSLTYTGNFTTWSISATRRFGAQQSKVTTVPRYLDFFKIRGKIFSTLSSSQYRQIAADSRDIFIQTIVSCVHSLVLSLK